VIFAQQDVICNGLTELNQPMRSD